MTKFNCIVADPPWQAEHQSCAGPVGKDWNVKARPSAFYDTMPVDEICKLEVPSADKAHLWLWVVNQHVDWGYAVANAWGFKVSQMITWKKPGLGVGRFQCNSESVLVCRKGNRQGNPFGMTGGTCFEWPRGRHSAKPDEFFKLVESTSPGPYLEMFSRSQRKGWDVWGNQVESTVHLSNPMDDPAFR